MDLDRFFVALATTSPQIGVLCIIGLLLVDSIIIVKINLFCEDTCNNVWLLYFFYDVISIFFIRFWLYFLKINWCSIWQIFHGIHML